MLVEQTVVLEVAPGGLLNNILEDYFCHRPHKCSNKPFDLLPNI
jgi:hypothetical protein